MGLRERAEELRSTGAEADGHSDHPDRGEFVEGHDDRFGCTAHGDDAGLGRESSIDLEQERHWFTSS